MKTISQVMVGMMVYGVVAAVGVSAGEISTDQLEERVQALEARVSKDSLPGGWAERVQLSGVIEAEAAYAALDVSGSDGRDEHTGDIALSSVEVGIDVAASGHVTGHILFLYEDGEDLSVDEGFIEISGGEICPLYLKAGEMYVPFGRFESCMISDPLTLDLGETRETAVEAGFDSAGFYGSAYVFNRERSYGGSSDHLDNYGVQIGYAMERDGIRWDVGAGYISTMLDSGGFGEWIDGEAGSLADAGITSSLSNDVPGMGVHALVSMAGFTVIGEYVTLLEKPEWAMSDAIPGSLAAAGIASVYKRGNIAAWTTEIAYTCQVAGREATIAGGLQGSRDAGDFLPERRYVGSVGVSLFESTTLALECCRDEFQGGDTSTTLTAQLAMGF